MINKVQHGSFINVPKSNLIQAMYFVKSDVKKLDVLGCVIKFDAPVKAVELWQNEETKQYTLAFKTQPTKDENRK